MRTITVSAFVLAATLCVPRAAPAGPLGIGLQAPGGSDITNVTSMADLAGLVMPIDFQAIVPTAPSTANQVRVVEEPSSVMLFFVGLLAACWVVQRKSRSRTGARDPASDQS